FKGYSEFILIEIDYGFNTKNLDTTVIILNNRFFILYTLVFSIIKAILLTIPLARIPRIIIIFIYSLIKSKSRGVKPFIILINNST
ncbi:uncharacterized protein CLUP02_08034, partial [Colletotrichum lupini]